MCNFNVINFPPVHDEIMWNWDAHMGFEWNTNYTLVSARFSKKKTSRMYLKNSEKEKKDCKINKQKKRVQAGKSWPGRVEIPKSQWEIDTFWHFRYETVCRVSLFRVTWLFQLKHLFKRGSSLTLSVSYFSLFSV